MPQTVKENSKDSIYDRCGKCGRMRCHHIGLDGKNKFKHEFEVSVIG